MIRALKVALLSSVGVFAFASQGEAADHGDAPTAIMNSAADITDVYAFVDANDGTKVNMILNLPAAAMFSDAVQYAFHVENTAGFGVPGAETLVICQFEANQTIACWAGDTEYVTGDASATAGIASTSGALRVFAGSRNDPFFFNATGFFAVLDTVKGAAGGLTFDGAGCPALDMATSMALVGQLSTEVGGGAPVNDFATANVSAIVVQIDRSVFGTQPILAIWASTHTR